MKKIMIYTLLCLLMGMSVAFVSCSTQTYMGRWIKWRASDILDHEKFPFYSFSSSDQPFHFIVAQTSISDTILIHNKKSQQSLRDFLITSNTTALLIIKHDTLLYEGYFNGYTRESINTSFSVAKSITSLMVGKALEQGLIKTIEDPITHYLPELRQADIKYDSVTIEHLLNMRSGIQFKDHDLPWGDKPKAYYHPRLRERISELPIKFEPGSGFQYNSYNPIVIGMLLESVTNQSPAKYFEETIWNKLGMEFSGSWSFDSDESLMTKMESGLNLRAIDFAKFGRLILNHGQWDGTQIISSDWMDESVKISSEHKIPEFGDEIFYEKFWWLHSKDQKHAYIISGWGHLGQYLYVFPDEKIIIVRMGKDLGKVDSWKNIFLQLVKHTN